MLVPDGVLGGVLPASLALLALPPGLVASHGT